MLVELIAQTKVDGEIIARLPVVLGVEMQPIGPSVLVATSDPRQRGCRIAEEEVGEGVAGELTGKGECAARIVWLFRSQLQMEVVGAELQPVCAAIERDVVEKLEVLVVASGENGRIAERVVEPAGRDLRKSHIPGVGRNAKQSHIARKRISAVLTNLAAVHGHPSDAELVQ